MERLTTKIDLPRKDSRTLLTVVEKVDLSKPTHGLCTRPCGSHVYLIREDPYVTMSSSLAVGIP